MGDGAAGAGGRGAARPPGAQRPTIRRAAVALVLGLAALVQVEPIADLDLWWLLKAGEHMVATRTLLTADPFSWTAAGRPWLNHAWGFELVLYGVYALAGFRGLGLLGPLFALVTFALLYRTLRRDGIAAGWALGVVAGAALLTRGFWTPRPQVVTYLALAALWAVVWEYREGREDRLAWLPPLLALWANLHGGFLVGLGVLGLAAVGQVADALFDGGAEAPRVASARRLLAVWVLSAAAALANPFHARALLFPLHVVGDRAAKDAILEWLSPAFHYPELRLFEVLLLLLLGLPWLGRRRPLLGDVGLLLAFVYLSLDAIRNIPLLVVVLAPVVGHLVAEAGAALRPVAVGLVRSPDPRAWALAGLVLLAPVAGLRDLASLRRAPSLPRWGVGDVYPARAAEFLLAARLPGRLYNDYGWGGYLTWRLFPHYRVFIDGRVAIYPAEVREDYFTIHDVRPGWAEALARRRIELLLLRRAAPLATVLRETPGWRVAYEDDRAVVFQRRPGGGA